MAFQPGLSDNEEVQLLGVFPWMHSRNSDFPVALTTEVILSFYVDGLGFEVLLPL